MFFTIAETHEFIKQCDAILDNDARVAFFYLSVAKSSSG